MEVQTVLCAENVADILTHPVGGSEESPPPRTPGWGTTLPRSGWNMRCPKKVFVVSMVLWEAWCGPWRVYWPQWPV